MIKITLLVLVAGIAMGQSVTGGISGQVQDPSGAGIAQTKLSLTNLETGERRSADSGDTGAYSFVAVAPGRYRIEAEHEGFKKVTEQPIEVRVQQFVALDLTLTDRAGNRIGAGGRQDFSARPPDQFSESGG